MKRKGLVVVVVVIIVVIAVVIGLLIGLLPGGGEETSDSCPDCLFEQSDWENGGEGEYFASRERCDSVLVRLSDNILSIKKRTEEEAKDVVKSSLVNFSQKIPGADQDFSILTWTVDKTMRNNETVKLVFSDTGTQYAGCGNFDGPLFTAKPTGDTKVSHMLWKSQDNPTYLPFYVSRNGEDRTVCMFVEAQGAPIEISVSSTSTEWLIYSDEEVKFYSFNGQTVQDALDACLLKWKEIYPDSDSSIDWTDNFIVGSLTPSQIKTDQENSDSPATHYILSPDSVSMTSSGLKITGGQDISDYNSSVYLSMTASQKLDQDSGIVATKENGYYPSNNEYFLDFEKAGVSTTVATNFVQQDKAGVIISGLLRFPKGDDCKESFYCSEDLVEVDNTSCKSAEFGDGHVFQKYNLYDVSMKKAFKSGENLVIETMLSPGTIHFHRTDLELTVDGLKTCYHNLFNLPRLGIGAVTCNMCAGVVPSTDSEKSICFTWSQLSLLMPYVIMSGEQDLTAALSGSQNDVFAKLKETFAFRKQLHHFLANPDVSLEAKSNGILFGENLFMVVNLEKSTEDSIEFAIPSGQWLAPQQQAEGTFLISDSDSSSVTYEESISKLVFFKLGNIHVIRSSDNENHLEVHVMQLKNENIGGDILGTFNINGHTTNIRFDYSENKVSFEYQSSDTSIDKSGYLVSKLLIYYWNKGNGNLVLGATSYDVGADSDGVEKINVVFEYVDAAAKTIFENREQKIVQDGGDGR
ncbi:hypothetical protein ACHWQZ_G005684 [Mnemiopsis leidyi]